MVWDTSQPYTELGPTDMITDRAGTTKEGPINTDRVADHLAETAVHQSAEADIPTAQAVTIHAASMDLYIAQIDLGEPHTICTPGQFYYTCSSNTQ